MGLMDDFSNPRVQAHACAAVVNFAGARGGGGLGVRGRWPVLLSVSEMERVPAGAWASRSRAYAEQPSPGPPLPHSPRRPAADCPVLPLLLPLPTPLSRRAEASDQDTIAPYLDALIGKLLALLQRGRRNVQARGRAARQRGGWLGVCQVGPCTEPVCAFGGSGSCRACSAVRLQALAPP